MTLSHGQNHTIILKIGQDYYEGYFIASSLAKNVILYENKKKAGVLKLFSKDK